MRDRIVWFACVMVIGIASIAGAQQRPLVTEDPETIGAGNILIEAGFDALHEAHYPLSGLDGNLLRLPTLGVSFGLSSIAELQIDGGLYNRLNVTARKAAPFSDQLDFSGDSTSSIEDLVIATKIRLVGERPGRPAFGLRFATRLPNASNESGLGLDTTDFFVSALVGKTVQSVRLVGNIGFGILAEPTRGDSQNDVLTYGVSFARAVRQGLEIVGEVNGRVSTRDGEAPVGTDTLGSIRIGGRFTHKTVRIDGGLILGLTSRDPTVGLTAGLTWVFKAFTVP